MKDRVFRAVDEHFWTFVQIGQSGIGTVRPSDTSIVLGYSGMPWWDPNYILLEANMRVRNHRLGVGFGVLLLAAVSACGGASGGATAGEQQGVTSDTIRLGTSLPLTGGIAAAGQGFKAGLEAAVDQVNDEGGINGRKVELTILDDGFETPRSVANILRLIEQTKVFALDFPVGSAALPGSFPNVERAGIPMFGPYLPPDPNLDEVYFVTTPHHEQAQIISNWLGEQGLSKVGFIGQDNELGHAVLEGLESQADASGIEVVESALTEAGSTNVSPAVLSVKSSSAEAVVLGTDNSQTALVLKMAKDLNWKPVFIGGSSATNPGSEASVGAAGDAAEGLYGASVTALPTQDTDAAARYREAMAASNPDQTESIFALTAYATQQVLFHILEEMGDDLTWDNFQATAESLQGFETGLLPPITFGSTPDGHTGAHGVIFTQYTDGKWNVLSDTYQLLEQE